MRLLARGKIVIPFVLLSWLPLWGCSNAVSPNGAITPTGTLIGQAFVIDANEGLGLSPAGIAIQVDSSSTYATTDSNGNWQLSGVAQGTHVLNFFKLGFGQSKIFNVSVPGAGVIYVQSKTLAQKPNTLYTIDSILVEQKLNGTATVYSHGGGGSGPRANLNFSLSEDSSRKGQFISNQIIAVTTGSGPDSTKKSAIFSVSLFTLRRFGAKSGSKVYATVSSVASLDALHGVEASEYVDPSTHTNNYTAVGPISNIVSFTLP